MNNDHVVTRSYNKFESIVVICLLLASLLSSCNTQSQLGIEDIKYIPFLDNMSDAEDIAKQWKLDAYLVSAISMMSMKSDSSPLMIDYTFRSPSDPGAWLSVNITIQGENNVLDTTMGTYDEGDDRPLPLEIDVISQNISAQDAINIALNNGGLEFINKHNAIDNRSYLKLSQHNTAFAAGDIELVVGLSTEDLYVFFVTINPSTGEVVEIYRNDE